MSCSKVPDGTTLPFVRPSPVSILIVLLLGATWPRSAEAQQPAPLHFTLAQAVQYALEHYPAVRAALEESAASTAAVDVAHGAYWPHLDTLWQSNRATANNIFGQVFPQSVLPAMSGPVRPETSWGSVWGSAAGALLTWEPVDFGLRKATVTGAEAAVARSRATEALTRLEVARTVAEQFLGVVAAERAVVAVRADVERRQVLFQMAQVLVTSQLRPGAEASRADTERLTAETRLEQANHTLLLARVALARGLGLNGLSFAVDAEDLITRVPGAPLSTTTEPHPLLAIHQSAVDVSRSSEAILSRTDLPRVFVQSSVFARGSGANPTGALEGGVNGLGLERANWAAGVQVQFPNLFDFGTLRARKAAAEAAERRETALFDEARLTVISEQETAAASVATARAIALKTPVQLRTAQESESQARARYQAGLAPISEVAESQALLVQAEYQDQIARLEVWHALLNESAAHGSLDPFLQLLGRSGVPPGPDTPGAP